MGLTTMASRRPKIAVAAMPTSSMRNVLWANRMLNTRIADTNDKWQEKFKLNAEEEEADRIESEQANRLAEISRTTGYAEDAERAKLQADVGSAFDTDYDNLTKSEGYNVSNPEMQEVQTQALRDKHFGGSKLSDMEYKPEDNMYKQAANIQKLMSTTRGSDGKLLWDTDQVNKHMAGLNSQNANIVNAQAWDDSQETRARAEKIKSAYDTHQNSLQTGVSAQVSEYQDDRIQELTDIDKQLAKLNPELASNPNGSNSINIESNADALLADPKTAKLMAKRNKINAKISEVGLNHESVARNIDSDQVFGDVDREKQRNVFLAELRRAGATPGELSSNMKNWDTLHPKQVASELTERQKIRYKARLDEEKVTLKSITGFDDAKMKQVSALEKQARKEQSSKNGGWKELDVAKIFKAAESTGIDKKGGFYNWFNGYAKDIPGAKLSILNPGTKKMMDITVEQAVNQGYLTNDQVANQILIEPTGKISNTTNMDKLTQALNDKIRMNGKPSDAQLKNAGISVVDYNEYAEARTKAVKKYTNNVAKIHAEYNTSATKGPTAAEFQKSLYNKIIGQKEESRKQQINKAGGSNPQIPGANNNDNKSGSKQQIQEVNKSDSKHQITGDFQKRLIDVQNNEDIRSALGALRLAEKNQNQIYSDSTKDMSKEELGAYYKSIIPNMPDAYINRMVLKKRGNDIFKVSKGKKFLDVVSMQEKNLEEYATWMYGLSQDERIKYIDSLPDYESKKLAIQFMDPATRDGGVTGGFNGAMDFIDSGLVQARARGKVESFRTDRWREWLLKSDTDNTKIKSLDERIADSQSIQKALKRKTYDKELSKNQRVLYDYINGNRTNDRIKNRRPIINKVGIGQNNSFGTPRNKNSDKVAISNAFNANINSGPVKVLTGIKFGEYKTYPSLAAVPLHLRNNFISDQEYASRYGAQSNIRNPR